MIYSNHLELLQKEIDTSKSMLNLPDDWDDEGSVRIDPEAWELSVKTAKDIFDFVYDLQGRFVPIPDITPYCDGSVDVFFKNEKLVLLLNVKKSSTIEENENDNISFYGDDNSSGKDKIRGYYTNPKSVGYWLNERLREGI